MVRFDGYRRSLPLPTPKQQWQLLLWVFLLGMVAIVPQWFLARRSGSSFNSSHVVQESVVAGGASVSVRENNNSNQEEPSPRRSPDQHTQTLALVARLSQLDYSSVTDDAPFRNTEKEPWFGSLKILQEVSSSELWQSPAQRVTFAQLYRRPKDYRGKLVEFRGRVMGVFSLRAPQNSVGISQYYQLWICPEEENDPIVVYCLQLPEHFPREERMSEPVVVRGVFFKRWAYQAKDGLRFAPVVLAPSIRWEPVPAQSALPEESPPNPWVVVIVAALVTVFFLWYALRIREKQLFPKKAGTSASRFLPTQSHSDEKQAPGEEVTAESTGFPTS
ncbi:hypothetical protein [Thermogutta sp.]|uniref:hypothetical protein n=1 Tax=Thermogutta sp. TaxID=1962930 RepID=UPI00321F8A2B